MSDGASAGSGQTGSVQTGSVRTGAGPAPADAVLVDDALSAADATRSTARWLASALGAVPSLAVIASIVRAPGDAGFDAPRLVLGVLLAAAGAIVGVLGFARVLAPLALNDKDVEGVSFDRLPGQSFRSWPEFSEQLEALRAAETVQAHDALEAARASATAHDRTDLLRAERDGAAKSAAAAPADAALKSAADQAQATYLAAANTALDAADVSRSRRDDHADTAQQLDRLLAIRRDAYRLTATDKVGRHFQEALVGAVLATALVAAGIVLLGLAPKNSPSPARPAKAAAASIVVVRRGIA